MQSLVTELVTETFFPLARENPSPDCPARPREPVFGNPGAKVGLELGPTIKLQQRVRDLDDEDGVRGRRVVIGEVGDGSADDRDIRLRLGSIIEGKRILKPHVVILRENLVQPL